jgi:hypothetical protein
MMSTSMAFTCSAGSCVVMEKSMSLRFNILDIFRLFHLFKDVCLFMV